MIKIKTSKTSLKPLEKVKLSKISKESLANIILMILFCVGAVKSGFSGFKFTVFYQLLVGIAFFIVFVGRISKQSIVKARELFPFLIIFIIEIPIQKFFGQGYYSYNNAVIGFIVYFLMVVMVIIVISNKNSHSVWKIINLTVLFASILIIVQEIFYVFGIRLDDFSNLSLLFNGWKFQFYRPCGPFSEPSHFAELGLLSLYYFLFVERNVKKAALILAALFISTSTLGIIGGLLVVVMFLLSLGIIKDLKKSVRVCVYVVAVISFTAMIFWVNNTDNLVVERILRGGTSSVRILRSFEEFNELSPEHKLFGIGIQNQELYLNAFNIVLPSDSLETLTNREFAQTFGYMLCCTGIIGLIAFWCPLINRALKSNVRLKSFIVLFGLVCFTCCIFSRTIFLIYLIAFFTLKDILKKQT